MNSSVKPTANCVFLPMAGWYGDAAAASQTSSSGLDMVLYCITLVVELLVLLVLGCPQ